jgi:hypothetical protein
MKIAPILAALVLSATCLHAYEVLETNVQNPEQDKIDGYKDTPMQPPPNEQWHVHDPDRPQPPVAEPKYDGKPVPAPEGATVLFDGSSLDKWTNKEWKIDEDGAMLVTKKSQRSVDEFGDIQLHIEWMAPLGREGWGQKQGNSGVFLMNKYEVQVLNCWANRTYPDGMTGAIYGQQPPMFNACRKPGEWNAYDIYFKAPVFDGEKLVSPAYITVILNGVTIHDNYEIKGTTFWRKPAAYEPHGPTGPIQLQAHGNPNKFRNIWVKPLEMKLGAEGSSR